MIFPIQDLLLTVVVKSMILSYPDLQLRVKGVKRWVPHIRYLLFKALVKVSTSYQDLLKALSQTIYFVIRCVQGISQIINLVTRNVQGISQIIYLVTICVQGIIQTIYLVTRCVQGISQTIKCIPILNYFLADFWYSNGKIAFNEDNLGHFRNML